MAEENPTQPKRLKAIAMPRGFAARSKKWAEEDARAAEFRANAEERQKEANKARSEAMLKRVANGTAPHLFIRNRCYRSSTGTDISRRVWDNYITIGVVERSAGSKYEVSVGTRSGKRCVCIKMLIKSRKTGEWVYTRRGIVVPLKSAIKNQQNKDELPIFVTPMQDLLAMIDDAIKVASTMELHDPDNEVWIQPKNKLEEKQNENQ